MKKIFLLSAVVILLAVPEAPVFALRYIPSPQQLQPAPAGSQPNFSGNVNFQPQNPAGAAIGSQSAPALSGGNSNNQGALNQPQPGVFTPALGRNNINLWAWLGGLLAILLVVGLFWRNTKKSDDQ